MRFLGCFLSSLAVILVIGGVVAVAADFPGGGTADGETTAGAGVPGPSPIPGDAGAALTETAEISGTSTNEIIPSGSDGLQIVPTAVVTDVDVDDPDLLLPTFPLASVEATYTETYVFGAITVRFRPGAYSEEYAQDVAAKTVDAITEANAKLQTEWDSDLTVFLADQLFAEDCLGCQGFTESDFRWIFMLDDGSVVEDEFEALLVHESAHLIAGNTIHLPFDIFYVEGLATWVMTDDLVKHGYVTPVQSTAWVYEAGALPSLEAIMNDDFAGRMRKRVYYDAAAAFAFYVIETYGWDAYIELYRQNPIEMVLGKPLTEIESEWHAYLEPHRATLIDGVDGIEWWGAASQVIDAFGRFYADPDAVSADQYRLLTLSRLALNRAQTGAALEFLAESKV